LALLQDAAQQLQLLANAVDLHLGALRERKMRYIIK